MITLCYVASGVLLIGTGLLFNAGALSAATLTACWMALAFFYAVGTGIGGVTGPLLFGKLVETEQEINVMYGYLLGAVLMIGAGILEWFIGMEAAGKSLEAVAKPLTAHEEEAETPA